MATPDAEDAPGYYNNSHRAFLQAIFARSTLRFEDAKPILAAILSAQENRTTLTNDITFEDFNNYISTLNAAIHPFDYEIRYSYPQSAPTRSQDTAIYAVVNMASDPQTQLATTHSPDEIAFVKRVLDAIFETNNTISRETVAVKGMEATNLRKAPRERTSAAGLNGDTDAQTQGPSNTSLTLNQAEQVLAKLVVEGWLEKSRAGYFSLSPRALMELRGWLVEMYNEEPDEEEEGVQWQRIKFCEACRDIVTVGQRCANRDCLCRFHDFCTASFFREHPDRKCPTCKEDWTSNHFVGERAARGAGAVRPSAGPSNGTGSSRRSRPSEQNSDSSD